MVGFFLWQAVGESSVLGILKLPAASCGECSARRQCFAATVRKFTIF
jgi:hypothetical protein